MTFRSYNVGEIKQTVHHFGFAIESENSRREIILISWRHRFQKALFSRCFTSAVNATPFSTSFDLKSVLRKIRFRDGLVYTVGLTEEIQLRFQISPFCRARFRKDPFSWRDGLVYTVGLTEGIKLHFQIAPFWRVRFRKDPFSWRISVNGTEAMQIKLCFQINPV